MPCQKENPQIFQTFEDIWGWNVIEEFSLTWFFNDPWAVFNIPISRADATHPHFWVAKIRDILSLSFYSSLYFLKVKPTQFLTSSYEISLQKSGKEGFRSSLLIIKSGAVIRITKPFIRTNLDLWNFELLA